LNYVSFEGAQGNQVILKDELVGNTFEISPKHIVNFIHHNGDADSYLVLDYPELREILDKDGFFVENKAGHPLLIFPFYDKVIVKTYAVHQAPEEIQEIIRLISSIFLTIKLAPEQIVFRFPSVHSVDGGTIFRQGVTENKAGIIPVLSLVGGVGASYHTPSEQVADKMLRLLGKARKVDIRRTPIGGGKDYPVVGMAKIEFIKKVAEELSGGSPSKPAVAFQPKKLFERYGTRALEVAKYIKAAKDEALESNADWSRREVEFLIEREKTVHVDDIILRRSMLVWLGQVDKPLVEELAEIMGEFLGWTADQISAEIQRTFNLLKDLHGIIL
jgi:glycerol-3-phosphate dehydrogenase